MTHDDGIGNPAELPRSELVRRVRKRFGVTQAGLAAAMGTSTKAIQSYEQGWRNVPTRALIQLLVLLAIHRRREVDKVPCWEVRKCSPEQRQNCVSHTIGDGQLCWFLTGGGGGCCVPPGQTDADDALLPCMGCAVIRRLLSSVGTGGGQTRGGPPGDAGGSGSAAAGDKENGGG